MTFSATAKGTIHASKSTAVMNSMGVEKFRFTSIHFVTKKIPAPGTCTLMFPRILLVKD